MELVEGKTLAESLRRKSPLPEEDVVKLGILICKALTAAHAAGLIHRDVKPANILLEKGRIPKLTDFGLARLQETDHTHTKTGAILGTLDYMSPEQHRDPRAVDERSDIWSLGATLYEAAVGESPRVIRGERIPPSLRIVLLKALEDEPEKRFQTAAELATSLRELLVGPTTETGGGPRAENDLLAEEGECRNCRTINATKRKHCKSCGHSLREPCIGCCEEIPIWEQFCPECGCDIAKMIQDKIAKSHDLQATIERLRQEYRHREALEMIQRTDDLDHPRLIDFHQWANKTTRRLNHEREELEEKYRKALVDARRLTTAGNFKKALQILAKIPQGQRTLSLLCGQDL